MKNLVVVLAVMASVATFAAGLSPLTTVVAGGTTILANASGMTVYTYDPDQPGISNCTGGCAQVWPPVLVPNGSVLSAPVGTTVRADGTTQVTFQGHPLYTYVGDHASGQTSGNGIGGIWHIVTE